ncbi:hypothetical protein C7974DRAFT_380087 [Boeremia exigua]|uniref:uncharacterized protein n=1 Tax=Boeremia exigua TaxID=749465 RepID=UPI001E8CB612|nr:uncharacterized protein C7974DRAFT_380087 [Boeremia exigua]KAH6615225.1 hypothetical protein C7974DRAFT_380087 [Boeremia exigua]
MAEAGYGEAPEVSTTLWQQLCPIRRPLPRFPRTTSGLRDVPSRHHLPIVRRQLAPLCIVEATNSEIRQLVDSAVRSGKFLVPFEHSMARRTQVPPMTCGGPCVHSTRTWAESTRSRSLGPLPTVHDPQHHAGPDGASSAPRHRAGAGPECGRILGYTARTTDVVAGGVMNEFTSAVDTVTAVLDPIGHRLCPNNLNGWGITSFRSTSSWITSANDRSAVTVKFWVWRPDVLCLFPIYVQM